MKKLLIITTAALLSLTMSAQQRETEARDSAKIYFSQAKYNVDLSLKGNKKEMDRICKTLEKALQEGKVEKLAIEGTASPEGGYEYNLQLTKNRADAIIKYITDRYDIPERKIESIGSGVAWDGLRDAVAKISGKNMDQETREGILDIIDNEPETKTVGGRIVTNRLNVLKAYKGGAPYQWLFANIFPNLRSGVSLYLFLYPVPEDQMPQYLAQKAKDDAEAAAAAAAEAERQAARNADHGTAVDGGMPAEEAKEEEEELVVAPAAVPVPAEKNFFMAVKTNLLYDAATVPNIGVEFYLKDNWSISAMMGFAWWNTKKSHLWVRDHGVEIEARKWLGALAEEKPLQGHHVGPYVMAQTYDYQLSGKLKKIGIDDPMKGYGYQSKVSYGAGVSYGYSLPVAKRLNIDFEIGVGFLLGRGYEYTTNSLQYTLNQNDPDGRSYLLTNGKTDAAATNVQKEWYKASAPGTHHSPFVTPADENGQSWLWWVGPTKVGITLVWLIGNGNENKK